jgi:hypothetical protein
MQMYIRTYVIIFVLCKEVSFVGGLKFIANTVGRNVLGGQDTSSVERFVTASLSQ